MCWHPLTKICWQRTHRSPCGTLPALSVPPTEPWLVQIPQRLEARGLQPLFASSLFVKTLGSCVWSRIRSPRHEPAEPVSPSLLSFFVQLSEDRVLPARMAATIGNNLEETIACSRERLRKKKNGQPRGCATVKNLTIASGESEMS